MPSNPPAHRSSTRELRKKQEPPQEPQRTSELAAPSRGWDTLRPDARLDRS